MSAPRRVSPATGAKDPPKSDALVAKRTSELCDTKLLATSTTESTGIMFNGLTNAGDETVTRRLRENGMNRP
jgi:hypothetical protein